MVRVSGGDARRETRTRWEGVVQVLEVVDTHPALDYSVTGLGAEPGGRTQEVSDAGSKQEASGAQPVQLHEPEGREDVHGGAGREDLQGGAAVAGGRGEEGREVGGGDLRKLRGPPLDEA